MKKLHSYRAIARSKVHGKKYNLGYGLTRDRPNRRMVFLGLIFIAAGLFRLFDIQSAFDELLALSLPIWLAFPLVLFELALGIFLILNLYKKQTLIAASLFLAGTIMIALVNTDFSTVTRVFFIDPEPTDILLHVTYLVIVISLLPKDDW